MTFPSVVSSPAGASRPVPGSAPITASMTYPGKRYSSRKPGAFPGVVA